MVITFTLTHADTVLLTLPARGIILCLLVVLSVLTRHHTDQTYLQYN